MTRVCLAGVFCLVLWSSCLGGTIIFDDAHRPTHSVFGRNPTCPYTDRIPGGYRDLFYLLAEEGFHPEVLESPNRAFTPDILTGKCLVIINAPCIWGDCSCAYYPQEIAALLEYTYNGGNLLVMAEPFIRFPLYNLIMWMGLSLGDSIIAHWNPLAYEVHEVNTIFDEGAFGDDNFLDHMVFSGVNEIVFYGGDFVTTARVPECLITSETMGEPPAAMAGATDSYGDGRIVLVGDSDWVSSGDTDGDGVANLFDRDNERFVVNLVEWLCPQEDGRSYARTIGYWRHQCRGNGHTEISQDSLTAMEGTILASSSFFTECFDTSGCELMLADPPNNDMLRKGAQQLYALWLNRESGKIPSSYFQSFLIAGGDFVRVSDLDVLISEIEGILCDPASTLQELEYAKDLAESVNSAGHEEDNLNALTKGITITPGEIVTIPVSVYNCSPGARTYDISAVSDLEAWISPSQVQIEDEGFVTVDLNLRVREGSIDGMTIAMLQATSLEDGGSSTEFVGAEITGTAGVTMADSPNIELEIPSNPAKGNAIILLHVGRDQRLHLALYDVAGRVVRHLARGPVSAGTHRFDWNGTDDFGKPVASGIYFARLTGFGFSRTGKIILTR